MATARQLIMRCSARRAAGPWPAGRPCDRRDVIEGKRVSVRSRRVSAPRQGAPKGQDPAEACWIMGKSPSTNSWLRPAPLSNQFPGRKIKGRRRPCEWRFQTAGDSPTGAPSPCWAGSKSCFQVVTEREHDADVCTREVLRVSGRSRPRGNDQEADRPPHFGLATCAGSNGLSGSCTSLVSPIGCFAAVIWYVTVGTLSHW